MIPCNVALANIKVNFSNREPDKEKFQEIVESIKNLGLVTPIIVKPRKLETGDNDTREYEILDGYLRYVACKFLGHKTIPCLIYTDDNDYKSGTTA